MKRWCRRVLREAGMLARRFPSRVQCNVCGWQGRCFASDSWHRYSICPSCGSQVRHRLLGAALRSVEGLRLDERILAKRVLHVAPERIISDLLAGAAADYVTADLGRDDVDLQLDLCDMGDIPTHSFDVVIACDVLEHVADDSAALREIRRVLAPNGWVILTVPQADGRATRYEDPAITTPEARKRAFGQEDHLRIYGSDFGRFLEAQGFAVTVVDESSFDPAIVRRHVLAPPVHSQHPLATNHRKVFFGHILDRGPAREHHRT